MVKIGKNENQSENQPRILDCKIERNIQRDDEVNKELNDLGYTVFRFWETEMKKNLDECITKTI